MTIIKFQNLYRLKLHLLDFSTMIQQVTTTYLPPMCFQISLHLSENTSKTKWMNLQILTYQIPVGEIQSKWTLLQVGTPKWMICLNLTLMKDSKDQCNMDHLMEDLDIQVTKICWKAKSMVQDIENYKSQNKKI